MFFLLSLLGLFVTARYVVYPYVFNMPPVPVEITARNLFQDRVRGHEGDRNDVYIDSLGILTVGIGHKVVPADMLRLGDRISDERKAAFFAQDTQTAFSAALAQAQEAGKYTARMIAALAEVNFQLGTGWTKKFANTWKAIKAGNINDAVNRLEQSDWYEQTPVRVAAFISTLQTEFA
jgi:GH24 family phage-related lysozyme (muramidase)